MLGHAVEHLKETKFLIGFVLVFFTERWFGKDWREVYLVLHEDSTLTWYSERGESSPEGGLLLKDAPEMIAAGQVFYLFLLIHSG